MENSPIQSLSQVLSAVSPFSGSPSEKGIRPEGLRVKSVGDLPVSLFDEQEPVGQSPSRSEDQIDVSPDASRKYADSVQQFQDDVQEPSQADQALERVRQMVDNASTRATAVRFIIEEQEGNILIKVVNKDSGEVVRQIPPDDILKLQKRLTDLRGVLFHQIT